MTRALPSTPARTPPGAPPGAPLARLSISLPGTLLAQLDAMVGERALPNRSQLIAELIRHELADHGESRGSGALAGTITLIYRADGGRVRHALARAQSAFVKDVISSQHVFLEGDQSLEVLLVQGPGQRLLQLCDALRTIRGVLQTKLVTTTSLLPPLHARSVKPRGPGGTALTARRRTAR
jgi:CopG family nickel-responsive transcriptional regulator